MTSKRRSRESMAKRNPLPEVALTDILSRLPIKSLTRFESVSKCFSALIKSPRLISAHLRRSSRHGSFIVRRYHNPTGSLFSLATLTHNPTNLTDIEIPFLGSLIRFPKIVGSCNGLVCLDVSSCYATAFVIWNIGTKQYSGLFSPTTNGYEKPIWMVSTGFGFDSETNDYKLVRIVNLGGKNDDLRLTSVEVFSVSTGYWRVINGRVIEESIGDCVITEGQNGVIVNGGLHWTGISAGTGRMCGQRFVVSFDLGTEELRKIPTPEVLSGACFKVFGFKGLLALAYYNARSVYPGYGRPMWGRDPIELCVMDNPGRADGKFWSEMNTNQVHHPGFGYPIGVVNETGLIMKMVEGQYVQYTLYDPSNQIVKRLYVGEVTYSCEFYSYMESLVPVTSDSGHDEVIEEDVIEV